MWCYEVPHGIPSALFVWISSKTLCSQVLASFADSKLLDFSRLAIAYKDVVYRALYNYDMYVLLTLAHAQ